MIELIYFNNLSTKIDDYATTFYDSEPDMKFKREI